MVPAISFYVGLYLVFPEFGVAFRPYKIFTSFVMVPETSIYKYDGNLREN